MSQENPPPPQPTEAVDHRHLLVSSRRIEGTPVYSRTEERLGTIHSLMIEKTTGKVAFAVLSFGGVFGLGEHVHPLPWEMLDYDVGLDAFVIDLSREQIESAPKMQLDRADRLQPEDFEEVSGYYAKLPWWGL